MADARIKFTCFLCGSVWTRQDNTVQHYRNVHGTSLYGCELCNHQFDNLISFSTHYQKVHPDTELNCGTCAHPFYDPAEKFIHQLSCSGFYPTEYKFHCLLCPSPHNSSLALAHHHQRTHPDVPLKCDKCPNIYPSVLALLNHYRCSHSIELVVKARHLQLNSSQEPKNKPSRKSCNLRQHLCNICGKTYSFIRGLRYHIKAVHFKNPIKCSLCPKSFTHRASYVRHCKMVHPGSWIKCTGCPKIFVTKKEMEKHSKLTHKLGESQSIKKCQICGNIFRSRHNLNAHVWRMHGGYRHKCRYCEDTFKTLSNLLSHMEIAHVNKLNVCSFCGRQFLTSEKLQTHIRCAHGKVSRDQRLKCAYCQTSFHNNTLLLAHVKNFHKEKLFNCQFCGDCFGVQMNFKKHLERKHGKTIADCLSLNSMHLNCPECSTTFKSIRYLMHHYKIKHDLGTERIMKKQMNAKQSSYNKTRRTQGEQKKVTRKNQALIKMYLKKAMLRLRKSRNKTSKASKKRKLFRRDCLMCIRPRSSDQYCCWKCNCQFRGFSSRRMHQAQCKVKPKMGKGVPSHLIKKLPVVKLKRLGSNVPDLNCQCQQCGLTLPETADLSRHIVNCQSYWLNDVNKKLLASAGTPKLYPCLKCGFCCVDKVFLWRHVQTEHASFAVEYKVCLNKQHKITTRGEGKFKCSFCDNESNSIESIRMEMLRHVLVGRRENSRVDE